MSEFECVVCGVVTDDPAEICADCWDDYENDFSDVFVPHDDNDDYDNDEDYEPSPEELKLFRELVVRVHDKLVRSEQGSSLL